MENERKKRKVENEEKKREEEDENEKMEKFFALIRSTRSMRDRLTSKEKDDRDKNLADDRREKPVGAWNPSFQPEDFAAEDDKTLKSCPETQAGPSSAAKREEEEAEAAAEKKAKEGAALDLNLSL